MVASWSTARGVGERWFASSSAGLIINASTWVASIRTETNLNVHLLQPSHCLFKPFLVPNILTSSCFRFRSRLPIRSAKSACYGILRIPRPVHCKFNEMHLDNMVVERRYWYTSAIPPLTEKELVRVKWTEAWAAATAATTRISQLRGTVGGHKSA
jgi:hypothetical protein